MVRTTPIYKPFTVSHLEGEQPYLGDVLTMAINHLLAGMILQVGEPQSLPSRFTKKLLQRVGDFQRTPFAAHLLRFSSREGPEHIQTQVYIYIYIFGGFWKGNQRSKLPIPSYPPMASRSAWMNKKVRPLTNCRGMNVTFLIIRKA